MNQWSREPRPVSRPERLLPRSTPLLGRSALALPRRPALGPRRLKGGAEPPLRRQGSRARKCRTGSRRFRRRPPGGRRHPEKRPGLGAPSADASTWEFHEVPKPGPFSHKAGRSVLRVTAHRLRQSRRSPAHAAARFPSSASLGFKRGFRSRKHRKGNVCVCRHPGDTLPPTDFHAPSKKRPITKALACARSPPLGAGGARTPRGGGCPAPCPALLDAGGAGEMLSRGEEHLT